MNELKETNRSKLIVIFAIGNLFLGTFTWWILGIFMFCFQYFMAYEMDLFKEPKEEDDRENMDL